MPRDVERCFVCFSTHLVHNNGVTACISCGTLQPVSGGPGSQEKEVEQA